MGICFLERWHQEFYLATDKKYYRYRTGRRRDTQRNWHSTMGFVSQVFRRQPPSPHLFHIFSSFFFSFSKYIIHFFFIAKFFHFLCLVLFCYVSGVGHISRTLLSANGGSSRAWPTELARLETNKENLLDLEDGVTLRSLTYWAGLGWAGRPLFIFLYVSHGHG